MEGINLSESKPEGTTVHRSDARGRRVSPCIPSLSICAGVRFGRKWAGASANRSSLSLASRLPVCAATHLAFGGAISAWMDLSWKGCKRRGGKIV
eukprot:4688407-Pleurochrysis_carterae.AAC.1